MIDLERTMEVDIMDLDFMCWLLGCYDIDNDDEEEEEDLKNND